MKVSTERLPKSVIAFDIELDQQQVNKGLDRAARKLAQQYTIPGFRPGKAPRFIVENYLGRARIMEEASDDLINKAFQDALKQESITPIGKANLESVEETPFRFRVTVPVEPIIEPADYRSYRLPYEVEPVSEETVDKLLDAQREQHVVLRELEEMRPAQDGDMVSVIMTNDMDEDDEDEDDDEDDDLVDEDEDDDDLDEDEDDDDLVDEEDDGVVVDEEADEDLDDEEDDEDDEGEATDVALVEGRIRPEIYQALLGTQPGDTRSVTIQYDDDEENEALRGKEVTYELEVKNVQERLLPEWDELPTLTEFEGDLQAMRANARQRLEHAAEERARKQLIDAFIERAIEETPVEVPDAMIEERATEMFHESVAQYTRYGITEEQYLTMVGRTHEEAVAELKETAEPDVRRSLVLREIIRREGIQLNDQDIQTELARFLADYDESRQDEMRAMFDNPRMVTMIASSAMERKLRDRLIAIATGVETDEVAPINGITQVLEPNYPATGRGGRGSRIYR